MKTIDEIRSEANKEHKRKEAEKKETERIKPEIKKRVMALLEANKFNNDDRFDTHKIRSDLNIKSKAERDALDDAFYELKKENKISGDCVVGFDLYKLK